MPALLLRLVGHVARQVVGGGTNAMNGLYAGGAASCTAATIAP